jgi:hypothetical protein
MAGRRGRLDIQGALDHNYSRFFFSYFSNPVRELILTYHCELTDGVGGENFAVPMGEPWELLVPGRPGVGPDMNRVSVILSKNSGWEVPCHWMWNVEHSRKDHSMKQGL